MRKPLAVRLAAAGAGALALLAVAVPAGAAPVAPAAAADRARGTTRAGAVRAAAAPAVPVASTDVTVTVRDGVQLAATLVVPQAAAPAGGWPVVVIPGTFAGDGVNANRMAAVLAGRGFVTASYIPRGLGRSTGEIDGAGPKDVADVSDVISWVLANAPADGARVGLASISYGAGFLPMAIAQDPRVKAAAMLSGWGDMYQSRYPNDTNAIAATWGLVNVGATQGRLSAEGQKFFTAQMTDQPVSQEQRDYSAVRSPQSYLPQLRSHNVPLYVSTSMNEMVWPADQTIRFYQDYPGVKHLDIVPGDHATTELFMSSGIAGWTWNAAFDWMDAHVAGRSGPVAGWPAVRVVPHALGGPNITTSNSFTQYVSEGYGGVDGAIAHRRFYLSGDQLADTPGSGAAALHQGRNDVVNNGLPMYQGAFELVSGIPNQVNLAVADPRTVGVWRSGPLAADTRIRGAVPFTLALTPSAGTGTVFAYLLDVAPDGNSSMIGHKPYSWIGATPGAPMQVTVAVPYQAYDLPAGHRLAAAVATNDLMYRDRNPVGSQVDVGGGSFVDLPVL